MAKKKLGAPKKREEDKVSTMSFSVPKYIEADFRAMAAAAGKKPSHYFVQMVQGAMDIRRQHEQDVDQEASK